MNQTIKFLVVEDDDGQWETYQDTATDLSTAELSIVLERQTNAGNALSTLLSNNYDGAIVDLNLSRAEPDSAAGNDVLKTITKNHRFPVLVVSGNLANLDPSIQESGFLKTFTRDTPNDDIFQCLLKIYSTGITRILGGRGQIERLLGDIFWRHLANNFDAWNFGNSDSERTLLRYTVAHLAEYLDLPNGEDKFYHSPEFYIKPPIRQFIATGDIIEKDQIRYIVLSPACDVAVRNVVDDKPVINAERVLLAPLIPVSRAKFLEKKIISEAHNSEARRKILDEIIKGQREKFVFLPPYEEIYASVVDLQNVYTWDLDQFFTAQRIATISGQFLKDIQSRFASYYGRQGQPDLNKAQLLSDLASKLSPT